MVRMHLLVFALLTRIATASIDSDLQIDGLYPPDIDHDWRFNWNAFPGKIPKHLLHRDELISLDSSTRTNKIEPQRKTFMDLASMLPLPNAEALMAASGVSLLQSAASASVPNIPKMVSTFFNIRDMFNNRRQPLSFLKSRSYNVAPGMGDQDMVFGKRDLRSKSRTIRRKNVTRRFKRPIVVAPIDQNTIDTEVKVSNQTTDAKNPSTEEKPTFTEPTSMERHTFVNSDFVGIPSPKGYEPKKINIDEKNDKNSTKIEKSSQKLPLKSRFILKNPLETTVRSSYKSGGNLFKSPPVMEDKFFTTSLRDLFMSPSNKDEEQKNKIVIITDDDLNDAKRGSRSSRIRERSRMAQKSRPSQPLALESRKPPAELPVYIQEQRQMTGMHPPPIQIPNIFEDAENEIKSSSTTKTEFKEAETKNCENPRKPKKISVKPTKNPVHSSVMDIISNHAPEHPVTPQPQTFQKAHEWSSQHPPATSYVDMNANMPNMATEPSVIPVHATLKNNNFQNWSQMGTPRAPKKVSQKHPAKKVKTTQETPTSYVNIEHEFNPWNAPHHNNNEQWAPNHPSLPPPLFKQLPEQFSQMDMTPGIANPMAYYAPHTENNYDDDESDENSDDEDDENSFDMMDEMQFPAESKKVVRLMMPEVKFPQKVSAMPSQQFQVQQFAQKKPFNPYAGYPGTTSNVEQQRYPSPHMMLNDGLLFQRYNLLKEIEQMQSNLFGGSNVDDSDTLMSNPMMQSQILPSPMMASPLISSPVQQISGPQAGPVLFNNPPSGTPPNLKSGSFSQKGKPMKLMKFRVL